MMRYEGTGGYLDWCLLAKKGAGVGLLGRARPRRGRPGSSFSRRGLRLPRLATAHPAQGAAPHPRRLSQGRGSQLLPQARGSVVMTLVTARSRIVEPPERHATAAPPGPRQVEHDRAIFPGDVPSPFPSGAQHPPRARAHVRTAFPSVPHVRLSRSGRSRTRTTGSYGVSPTLIGIWAMLRGQVNESLPVGLWSPKSTSATPWPSVPGSQAATIASAVSTARRGSAAGRTRPRPPPERPPSSRRSRPRSSSASERSARSPKNSAYGASPTTTTPTSAPAAPAPSLAYVTCVPGPAAALHRGQDGGAARGERPALALPGDRPAAGLAADVVGVGARHVDPLRALGERQRPASFFSSTSDWRTARRATARCSAEPKRACSRRSASASALRRRGPSRTSRAGCAAPRRRSGPGAPRPPRPGSSAWCRTPGSCCGTMTMSMPALIDCLMSLR